MALRLTSGTSVKQLGSKIFQYCETGAAIPIAISARSKYSILHLLLLSFSVQI